MRSFLPVRCFTLLLFGCAACTQQNTGTDSNQPDPGISGTYINIPKDSIQSPNDINARFNAGDCNVRTQLLSIGTGADSGANSVGASLFDHQYFVSNVVHDLYSQFWGREGELTLCAQVLDPANRPVLEAELNQKVTDYLGTIYGHVVIDSN